MNMTGSAGASFGAKAAAKDGLGMQAVTRNVYRFEFKGDIRVLQPDGTWLHKTEHVEEIHNLTTTEGRTAMLTNNFKGSGYTAAWFMGLISNTSLGAIAITDTAAKNTTGTPSTPTTNGWAESTGYSESTRPAITFGTASGASLDSSAAPSTFTINTTVALYGGFTVTNSTKGGTSGTIYGEGAFGSVISLGSGSTVTVYVTLTIASA